MILVKWREIQQEICIIIVRLVITYEVITKEVHEMRIFKQEGP